MTNETEYGPELVVDGVRLPWLRDDEEIQIRAADGYEDWDTVAHYTSYPNWWLHSAGKDRIVAIRLPATHPFYTVQSYNAKHGTQFKYWPGGDEAPGDWDGGEVLSRERGVHTPTMLNNDRWHWRTVHPFFSECTFKCDIIGYTPKPCADQQGVSEPLQSAGQSHALVDHGPAAGAREEAGIKFSPEAVEAFQRLLEQGKVSLDGEGYLRAHPLAEMTKMDEELGLYDDEAVTPSPSPQPNFVPCERTVRLCIEKLPAGTEAAKHPGEVVYATCKASLEALLPKPDRAEELALAWESAEPEPLGRGEDGVRKFIAWAIAQGEIRG